MLTTFEILLYAVVLLLLPLILHSLVTGSQPPEKGWLARYYRAEKHLNVAGNLFVLTICVNAVAKLGRHFGYIDPSAKHRLALVIGVSMAATLLAFLALWIRAALKVHYLDKSST
jgi:hypothetical protein